MRWILVTVASLLLILPLSTEGTPLTWAQPVEEQPEAKLQDVQKQLADLQKQQATLQELQKQLADVQKKIAALRQQEQTLKRQFEEQARAKEKDKEKEYYVKVDVKGRLRREVITYVQPSKKVEVWKITAQGMTWTLDLGANKEFLDLAKQLAGKTVLVTGTLRAAPSTTWTTYYSRGTPYYVQQQPFPEQPPTLVVATFKAEEPK